MISCQRFLLFPAMESDFDTGAKDLDRSQRISGPPTTAIPSTLPSAVRSSDQSWSI